MNLVSPHPQGFPIQAIFDSEDASGKPCVVLCVKATYFLGKGSGLVLAEKQLPLIGGDIHVGEPNHSSVRYETDYVPYKPKADVLCVGKAYAPAGKPVKECGVSLRVGKWKKTIRVVGNRIWEKGARQWGGTPSSREPFESMEVSYERAYGGSDSHVTKEPQTFSGNPLGKGYCPSGKGIDGLALPNLEDPGHPIKSWKDQPQPMGFGPIGRTWQPRLKKAGTYDEAWEEQRAPTLPIDFDEAFYNCAPEDQQFPDFLRGDEEVGVANMHPAFPKLTWQLPGIRLRGLFQREGPHDDIEKLKMNLDTLWVDMEELQMVLVWRGWVERENLPETTTFLAVQESLQSSRRPREQYRKLFVDYAKEEELEEGEEDSEEGETIIMEKA